MSNLRVETAGDRVVSCDCCGNDSRVVWGYVYQEDTALAAYYVQWTRGDAGHLSNFDFLIGAWGVEPANNKRLVAWVFDRTQGTTGAFMVIDSGARPAARSELCGQALSRQQVVDDPELMHLARRLLDAVWLEDPRIDEVKV